MKLMMSLLCILLLAGCQPKENKRLDTDFEGKIIYTMSDWEVYDADTAKWEGIRAEFTNDSIISYIDEGSFLSISGGTQFEYQYFNARTNKGYVKIAGNDSLLVTNASRLVKGEPALLDVSEELNTDTVLGYVCNKLTLKYKDETRIFLYSREFPTNPEWYQHTKSGSFDVLYKHMKAYFLSMRCEYPSHAFTFRATNIFPGKVPADIFPKVETMPQKPLN